MDHSGMDNPEMFLSALYPENRIYRAKVRQTRYHAEGGNPPAQGQSPDTIFTVITTIGDEPRTFIDWSYGGKYDLPLPKRITDWWAAWKDQFGFPLTIQEEQGGPVYTPAPPEMIDVVWTYIGGRNIAAFDIEAIRKNLRALICETHKKLPELNTLYMRKGDTTPPPDVYDLLMKLHYIIVEEDDFIATQRKEGVGGAVSPKFGGYLFSEPEPMEMGVISMRHTTGQAKGLGEALE